MDVTTDTEPIESGTSNGVDSDAVVPGPTGPSPEEATSSFKLDEAPADHVAIRTPALGGEASVSQGGEDAGMQGSPTICAEKATGAMETDPGTLRGGSSAGKLLGRGMFWCFLPASRRGSVSLASNKCGIDVLIIDVLRSKAQTMLTPLPPLPTQRTHRGVHRRLGWSHRRSRPGGRPSWWAR